MIQVTRLNRTRMILNSDLIEYIENTPDTVVTLINDRRITVMETAEELMDRVREYRRSLVCPEHPHVLAEKSRISGLGSQVDGRD